ncbi:hypothetical protein PsAD2_01630 [Pseudovibrio axinellae]|uniref:DUF2125 domain-containing protein n=1 Tax=Pseudovibrio axinellae TaxID=989403 RepID=A0A165ZQ78_9HYPH|nr:DUF2125 domain-containing protein [Pseudovibrio axinellae]KZL20143.1 hypothetical protein PsAD2_01630 [Pseudovibrio axinellae]SEQ23470.1 hypothetical protein SAMN05421798_102207 [Pseudovibrio axinellae]
MTEPKVSRPPRKSAYFVLAILVALIIGGWSAYWAVGRGVVSDVIRNGVMVAEADGGSLECGDQTLGGYPFRFELTCTPFRMDKNGEWYFIKELRGIALAYNPNHLIFEAISPAEANFGQKGPAYSANWKTAQASVLAQDGKPGKIDAVFKEPKLAYTVGDQSVKLDANLTELHLRRLEGDKNALEAALLVQGLIAENATGAVPLDINLLVQLPAGAQLLDGKVSNIADLMVDEELKVNVSSAQLKSGEFSIQTGGDLVIDREGRLNGTLPLVITGIHQLEDALKPLFPHGSKTLEALQKTAMSIGKGSAENGVPTLRLPVTIENGRARIAFFDLGPVPKLILKENGS